MGAAVAAGSWRRLPEPLAACLPPPCRTHHLCPLHPAADASASCTRYTLWTMLQLCMSPKTAYRHASYHKQTKNHWARDDPAFVVLCSTLVAVTATAYCLACVWMGQCRAGTRA